MRRADDSHAWLSAHLFLSGQLYGGTADRVVRELVAPIIARARDESGAVGHFFIRYGELGPHLRVRLRVPVASLRAVSERILQQLQAAAPGADLPSYESREGSRPRNPEAALGPVHAVRWIAYEPEIERYGGPVALPIAEQLFQASTDTAIALLEGLDHGSRASRLGRAMLATLATLHACFDRGGAAAFARQYGAGYLHALAGRSTHAPNEGAFATAFERQRDGVGDDITAAWECLDDGELPSALTPLVGEMARARRALTALCADGQVLVYGRRARTWAACASTLVASHVHMTNNRLGVTIPEEAYLAHVIAWALGSGGRPSASASDAMDGHTRESAHA